MDVLCIGSAVLDITARPIESQDMWREKQRISEIQIQTGGDAANQSLRLADLGCEAALAAAVGADQNGQMLKHALDARGVRTEFLAVKEGIQTGTALVLVNEAGERHTFSEKGAHSFLSKEDVKAALLEHPRAISLGSLFSMPELEADGLLEYLQAAREQKIPVFAVLAADKQRQGFEGIRPFLPLISYFLPSLYDALEMTGTGSAEEAADQYLEAGAGCVVIKCGSQGCYLASAEGNSWIPAVPVEPVDTTGAGDCMVALFISRILSGDTPKEACRYACVGASLSTLFPGASGGRLTEERLRAWREEHQGWKY